MFKNIVVVGLCLVFSGCASLGHWKGARDYRKSQIEGKRVWAGYGYHYMMGWNFSNTMRELDESIEKTNKWFENHLKEREIEHKKRMENIDHETKELMRQFGIAD